VLCPAVTHLVEGLSHETLPTLKVEKPPICLVGTWRPTETITEQQPILFLKALIRNKASYNVNNSTSIHNYKRIWAE
jgi:hypothetical protein